MKHLTIIAAALLLATISLAAEPGTLILSESAPCRSHVEFGLDQFDPVAMRADFENLCKMTKDRKFHVYTTRLKTFHKDLGVKWDKDTWMDHAVISFAASQYTNKDRIDPFIHVPAPPKNWMAPDFDDAAWLAQRYPLIVGRRIAIDREAEFGHRNGYLRFRFHVTDPTKATGLTLSMLYRGGVRVFLNGKEVARGHLPEGPLTPKTRGESYPLKAYVQMNKDGSAKMGTGKRDTGKFIYMGELVGTFEQLPKKIDNKRQPIEGVRNTRGDKQRKGFDITREQWDHYRSLRDRKLGPIMLPKEHIKKGENVLAIELRGSLLHPVALGWGTSIFDKVDGFDHCHLVRMDLRDTTGAARSTLERPAGMQVWVEDMHRRVFTKDHSDQSNPGTIRFEGAPNGSFSGQLAIGTDKALAGLKVTASDLTAASSALPIPHSALRIQFMPSLPLEEQRIMTKGTKQHGEMNRKGMALSMAGDAEVMRYAPRDYNPWTATGEEKSALVSNLRFFDTLNDEPITEIPADSCQAVWLTLDVPRGTAPGTYKGTVTVTANGVDPVTVPIVAEIHGWQMPDPAAFQANIALEHNPYGVARQYKVPVWSDPHFALMENSLRHLGRIGNDFVIIPVLKYSEFGNLAEPGMIKWIRKKDGTLTFDYTVLDRYLALVQKHWKRLRVVTFLIMHGTPNKVAVDVLDEASGKIENIDLHSSSPHFQPYWRAFAVALCAHMRELGLEKNMFWGLGWDSEGDAQLPTFMAQVAPHIKWACATHGHGTGNRHYYTCRSFIYKLANLSVSSHNGWQRPDRLVLNPRGGGSVICVDGGGAPFLLRVAVDRALVSGARGIGRIGVDHWDNVYLDGYKNVGFLPPGLAFTTILWPGKKGADATQRFEVLREGVQEVEARIFLEQQLVRKNLPEELATRVKTALYQHNCATLFIPINAAGLMTEYYNNWQNRSRKLFALAGEVANVVPLDADRDKLTVDLPARAKKDVEITIRNWTSAARAWTATGDQPWLQPAALSGNVAALHTLTATLDASSLPPGKAAHGKLTVTDTATGTAFPVEVTANVSKVMDYVPPDALLDRKQYKFLPDEGCIQMFVPVAKSVSRKVTISNLSGSPLAWQATVSVPWVKLEPASGKTPAQTPQFLTVTVAPPDKGDAKHMPTITFSEMGGSAGVEIPLAIYVMGEYKEPAFPQGEAVLLDSKTFGDLKSRPTFDLNRNFLYYGKIDFSNRVYKTPTGHSKNRLAGLSHSMKFPIPNQMIFDIEGKEYKAFSATVGIPYGWYGPYHNPGGPQSMRLNFQIYVDGELRAQSGYVKPLGPYRRLVVNNLNGAKKLRIVAMSNEPPPDLVTGNWCDPTFWK